MSLQDVAVQKRERRKKKKEIHHRSKIRKFRTKPSEVWGNKFDFKAISKRKVHGLPDL